MKKLHIFILSLCLFGLANAQVSNVKANFSCPGQVTVTYDLNTNLPTDATLYYSHDRGKTWLIAQTVSGDLMEQTSGTGKTITWNNTADNVRWGNFKLKVEVPEPPELECVEINGVCWAMCNVDAPGNFTAKPEDYGMYYQWNSKVGWSSTNPITSTDGSTWNSSNGNGTTTWEKANDPCPAGYRMPTQAELQSLIDAGSQWVTVNGVRGREFGTGENTIFLPNANCRRNDTGSLRDTPSQTGYYWSSSSYSSDLARPLILFNSPPETISVALFSKPFGMCIRCVRE